MTDTDDETSAMTTSPTDVAPVDKVDATTPPNAAQRPDPKLLELLVCPLTKTALVYDRTANELVSNAAKLAYPIRDGIPILLASEARELS